MDDFCMLETSQNFHKYSADIQTLSEGACGYQHCHGYYQNFHIACTHKYLIDI